MPFIRILTNSIRMKPDKIYLSLALLIIFTITSWITSCTHQANITGIPEICFGRDVLPIFVNSCAMPGSRCHNGQGGESRMALNSYTDISQLVVPGNPNASRVYKAIIAAGGENKMPPGQPLSLDNRTIIRLWIEQGAIWTVCPDTTAAVKSSYVNPRTCITHDVLPVYISRCFTTVSTGFHQGI